MLTHKKLRELISYDQATGEMTWLMGRGGMRPGERAGHCNPARGRTKAYWYVRIDRKNYSRGRLAHLWMAGRWPVEIDHIDGDSLNDAWGNLREATRAQNEANRGARRNNKLGVKGVRRRKGRFQAEIYRSGKHIWLGSFKTAEGAAAAYQAAACRMDGEFFAVGGSDALRLQTARDTPRAHEIPERRRSPQGQDRPGVAAPIAGQGRQGTTARPRLAPDKS